MKIVFDGFFFLIQQKRQEKQQVRLSCSTSYYLFGHIMDSENLSWAIVKILKAPVWQVLFICVVVK